MRRKIYAVLLGILFLSSILSFVILLHYFVFGRNGRPYESYGYLTVLVAEEIEETTDVESINDILLNSGVIRIFPDKYYLSRISSSIVPVSDDSRKTEIDYINSFLNYAGIFGWKLVDAQPDEYIFFKGLIQR